MYSQSCCFLDFSPKVLIAAGRVFREEFPLMRVQLISSVREAGPPGCPVIGLPLFTIPTQFPLSLMTVVGSHQSPRTSVSPPGCPPLSFPRGLLRIQCLSRAEKCHPHEFPNVIRTKPKLLGTAHLAVDPTSGKRHSPNFSPVVPTPVLGSPKSPLCFLAPRPA